MTQAKVSPKFQIVIPKDVREAVALRKGQRVHVIAKGGVITIVPDRPLSALRGFVRGIPTDGLRDKTDRI